MSKYFFAALGCVYSAALLAAQVSDETLVDVDGSQVYLEVAGVDDAAPLVLYLHGGPGNVPFGIVGFREGVGSRLEEEFLVAYLHQRGAGKSPAVPNAQQTIENHVNDVDKVVEFLATKYAKNEVHLVGHSWGGILTGLFAEKHGDRIGKLVFIGTGLNVRSMLRGSLGATLEWANENDQSAAIADLQAIDPSFDTLQHFGILSRWANQARGGVVGSIDVPAFNEANRIDITYPNWTAPQASIASSLLPQMLTVNLDSAIRTFKFPALFIAAENDTIAPVRAMRRDFDNYAGEKKLVVVEDSHHLPFMDQPQRVAAEIISFIHMP